MCKEYNFIMQISSHDNNPKFGAKIVFKDKGNCFSLRQKFQLKSIAKGIGNSSDRLYIGTRKYDNISVYDSNMHFQRKDLQILSNINNKNREYMFSHKNIQYKVEKDTSKYFYDLPKKERWNRFNNKMFAQLKDFLKDLNTVQSEKSLIDSGKTKKESRKILRQEVKEFTDLKRTYYKKPLTQKIKDLFTNNKKIVDEKPKKQESKTCTNQSYTEPVYSKSHKPTTPVAVMCEDAKSGLSDVFLWFLKY